VIFTILKLKSSILKNRYIT